MSSKVGNVYAVGLRLGNPVPDEGRVTQSRPLMMPDGTTYKCRQRERVDGTRYWTAEVPVGVAKAVHPDRRRDLHGTLHATFWGEHFDG